MLVTTIVCFLLASVRTFEKVAWLTWGEKSFYLHHENILGFRKP